MGEVLQIVQHTPLWVWTVFAVLVLFGLRAMRQRATPLWRLLVVPSVFIVWGVVSVLSKSAGSPGLIADWLGTLALGFAVGWLTAPLGGIRADPETGHLQLPGSVIPLARNLALFAVKYCLTAAMTIAPALHGALAPWDIGVSGLGAGYFLGWIARLAAILAQAGARDRRSGGASDDAAA